MEWSLVYPGVKANVAKDRGMFGIPTCTPCKGQFTNELRPTLEMHPRAHCPRQPESAGGVEGPRVILKNELLWLCFPECHIRYPDQMS